MSGRPKSLYPPQFRPLSIEWEDKASEFIQSIPILCPICKSSRIGPLGTHKRKRKRVEYFQCKNHECLHLLGRKYGKQFTLTTSYCFLNALTMKLKHITSDIMRGKTSQSAIAEKYGLSDALISYIRIKVEDRLHNLQGLEHLVAVPTDDESVAGDETFIRINGIAFYIIMFTGYTSHKILGIRVSKTRKEEDIRSVFEEAEMNTELSIRVVTADAWGSTQAMIKNLGRSITLVIHKHKKPFDKAVIWYIDYEDQIRYITKIGVKTDFFKKRAKREYFYITEKENLTHSAPKKKGRPLGVKNGQGKQKQNPQPKKKRGKKGINAPFDRGKRGYAKIDPSRKTVRLAKDVSPAVAAAFGETKDLFWSKSISNNLAENINSVIQAHIHLTGPKTPEGLEKRLRAFIIIKNNPELLEFTTIIHRFQAKILINEWKNSGIRRLLQSGRFITKYKKTEVLNN